MALPLARTLTLASRQDQFDIEGVRTSIGLAAWVDVKAERDSGVVTMLKGLGAVIHVKTNVPQSLMVSLIPSIAVVKR